MLDFSVLRLTAVFLAASCFIGLQPITHAQGAVRGMHVGLACVYWQPRVI